MTDYQEKILFQYVFNADSKEELAAKYKTTPINIRNIIQRGMDSIGINSKEEILRQFIADNDHDSEEIREWMREQASMKASA